MLVLFLTNWVTCRRWTNQEVYNRIATKKGVQTIFWRANNKGWMKLIRNRLMSYCREYTSMTQINLNTWSRKVHNRRILGKIVSTIGVVLSVLQAKTIKITKSRNHNQIYSTSSLFKLPRFQFKCLWILLVFNHSRKIITGTLYLTYELKISKGTWVLSLTCCTRSNKMQVEVVIKDLPIPIRNKIKVIKWGYLISNQTYRISSSQLTSRRKINHKMSLMMTKMLKSIICF